MKCPACGNLENKVIDSRLSKEGDSIRRRRECLSCSDRFTTHEKIVVNLPMFVKKDGRREPFNSEKIKSGIMKACQKRPISTDKQEEIVKKIVRHFQESTDKEISYQDVGELVIKELYDLDEVAYVRFASVYRSFTDVAEFMNEVTGLLKSKKQ